MKNNNYPWALWLLLVIVLCCTVSAEPTARAHKYGSVEVTVGAIFDGDTFRVDIPNWPEIVGKNMPVRINGIDTPEMSKTTETLHVMAVEARSLLVSKLRAATKVELRNMKRDKYFRIVADVFADDEDIGQLLLDSKLAKPYDGGKKPVWGDSDAKAYRVQRGYER